MTFPRGSAEFVRHRTKALRPGLQDDDVRTKGSDYIVTKKKTREVGRQLETSEEGDRLM